MTFEFILFLGLTILPIFYKINLWLYLFEKKQMSWDLWKKKLFNFWFPIELLFYILSFSLFFDSKLEIIFFPILFYFLAFYNIFVIGKILRARLEKTKYRKYGYLWVIIYLLDISFILYFWEDNYLYTYILSLFLAVHFMFIWGKILKAGKKKL